MQAEKSAGDATPSPPPRPLWRRYLPLLGLLLLAWVLSRLDLQGMGRALGRISGAALFVSCGAFSLNLVIKAFRWQRMLAAQGIALPPSVTLAAFMSGQFYGQVTLGRVGEFFRVEALLERGVRAGAALSSSVLDRVLDLFVVLLAGSVLGALVLGNAQVAALALALMIAGALFVRFVLIALGTGRQGRVQRAVDALAGSGRPLFARVATFVRDLAQGIEPLVRPAALAEALLWTLIAWSFYAVALFALADGLEVYVSRILLTATAAFAALSALLPVTISGLGARELIYMTVLQKHGVLQETAAVLSLLHLFVMSVCATLLGLLGVAWRHRQRG
jgi:uncharacterized protein (TIRG00374 family)